MTEVTAARVLEAAANLVQLKPRNELRYPA